MIQLQNVSKVFKTKQHTIHALRDVSLHVKKGEIYGVIGYSGAGKSTLIRCVNLLETPTDGKVTVAGTELTSLSHNKLNESRKKIGMIFQGFNLLKTATVKDNIAIPLKLSGIPSSDIKQRVNKYLDIVGLGDKENAYPSELSGGQKQRVAIARALAHEPEVLLSDEATSALDPETTDAILDLLVKINQELGVTILLITHEMDVIQKICDSVAVIDDGELVESGSVLQLFSSPTHDTTKRFVNSLFGQTLSEEVLRSLPKEGTLATLSFIGGASGEPALAKVSKKFDIYPNILSGYVTHFKNDAYGRLIVHIPGKQAQVESALQYLRENGVQVEVENYE